MERNEVLKWGELKWEWYFLYFKITARFYHKIFLRKIIFALVTVFIPLSTWVLPASTPFLHSLSIWIVQYSGIFVGVAVGTILTPFSYPQHVSSKKVYPSLNTQELLWLKSNASLDLLKYIFCYFEMEAITELSLNTNTINLNFQKIISSQFLTYFNKKYKNELKLMEAKKAQELQKNLLNLKEVDILKSKQNNLHSSQKKTFL